jgi:hypothetical protein
MPLVSTTIGSRIGTILSRSCSCGAVRRQALLMAVVASLVGYSAPGMAGTIVLWDFQIVTTGTAGTDVPKSGTGTVSVIGSGSAATFSSGSGSTDPIQAGFGYQTTGYPAQGVGSGTVGTRFDVPTTGFSGPAFTGLEVKFDLRTSNAASRWFRVDHTVDGGTSWIEGTAQRMGAAANAGDTFHNNNLALINDPAALNNAAFGFRVVSVFSPEAFVEASSSTSYLANTAYEVARNTSSIYGGGTWRFDMVQVTAVPEPSTVGLGVATGLGLFGAAARRRLRKALPYGTASPAGHSPLLRRPAPARSAEGRVFLAGKKPPSRSDF